MVDAEVGDAVICKLKDSAIVSTEETYDEKRSFEVIAKNYQGWYIYIPAYLFIKGTTPITERNHKSLDVDKRYIGAETFFITSSFIVKVIQSNPGMVCSKCNEYFEFAESNQEDGTMICFSCRVYPKYRSYVDDDEY